MRLQDREGQRDPILKMLDCHQDVPSSPQIDRPVCFLKVESNIHVYGGRQISRLSDITILNRNFVVLVRDVGRKGSVSIPQVPAPERT